MWYDPHGNCGLAAPRYRVVDRVIDSGHHDLPGETWSNSVSIATLRALLMPLFVRNRYELLRIRLHHYLIQENKGKEGQHMKSKLIVLGTVVAISLCLCACSPASKQVSVNVSWDDFKKEQHVSKKVEVAVDGSLTISLYSCPAEGRQWSESPQIGDETVLREVDHKYEPAPRRLGCTPAPGTPGREVWTFKALEKGMSTISIEYAHPWEGGEKEPMLTFVLTVVVK
jgi:predicted secreted protein